MILHNKAPQTTMEQSTAQPKLKLQQVDKDLLIDLAQLLEVEPYDYLEHCT